MALVSRSFVIPVKSQDSRPQLLVSVKKYTSTFPPRSHRGLTVVLTHAVTFRELPHLSFPLFLTIPM